MQQPSRAETFNIHLQVVIEVAPHLFLDDLFPKEYTAR
jgi:hypothetical protein